MLRLEADDRRELACPQVLERAQQHGSVGIDPTFLEGALQAGEPGGGKVPVRRSTEYDQSGGQRPPGGVLSLLRDTAHVAED